MPGHHVVKIYNQQEARGLLETVGVDPGAYQYLLPKAFFHCLLLKDIPACAALIIKQEMLAKGGEAAISRQALCGQGRGDVLLLGTAKQYRLLLDKLKIQPFGLKDLAGEIQSILAAEEPKPGILRLAGGGQLEIGRRPLIMGILNVTPDSFSDGGRYAEPARAVEHARQMWEEGADIIDVGGASARPNSEMIDEEEELKRVLPVIDLLLEEGYIVSVDTFRSRVAKACLERGVHIINDIGRLQLDSALLPVLAEHKAPVVLMHNRMQFRPNEPYNDLVSDILGELRESVAQALQAGLSREHIVIDPGIGFGKDAAQNRFIIKHLAEFKSLGYPVLLGASRKTFIGQTLDLEVDQRLEGSLAVVAMAVMNGADIIRVHDVQASRRVADMTWAVMRAGPGEPSSRE